MNGRLHFKHASTVTPEEATQVMNLQIKDIGLIWEHFNDHKDDKRCYVILVKKLDSIIAWGLIYYRGGDREWTFSVFVKRGYRRRGIGSRIYRLMKRRLRLRDNQIKVYRHDDASFAFFDRLQTEKD